MHKEEKERCCPERFPSPQLPSPTDCLPLNELEKVLDQIRDANELLLDLALSNDRHPHETYRKVFNGLVGVRVEITNQQGETVEGIVTLVGINFLLLLEGEFAFIFPFDKIDTIEPYSKYSEPYPTLKLGEMEPSLLRKLTFHFGKVVGESPELIQLFFGVRLENYLLLIGDKRTKVHIGGKIIDGIITDADKETLTLDVNGESNVIPLGEISLVEINA